MVSAAATSYTALTRARARGNVRGIENNNELVFRHGARAIRIFFILYYVYSLPTGTLEV